ncbi:MFS general substrate transporter [Coniochaeta sp. PMI_546]|nr:MFS general substrate transporter [Coniochaeta sp. PMI_546]
MVGTLDQSYRSSPGFDMGSIDAGSHDVVLDEIEEMGNFLPGYENSTGKTLPLPTQRHVIVMCVIFLFIVEFSMFVMEPPLQAVMEDFVCHEIYPDHVMEASAAEQDSRCKDPSVQTILAMARSWLMWTGMFVPLLVQIPYGMVADKYGRRPVLFCGLFGLLLSTIWNITVLRNPGTFSIWHLLLGSIALLIGGGMPVTEAMVWTILTDSTSPTNRTALFYKIYAMMLILSAVFRPFAAWLLSIDLWLPLWLGLVALVLSMLSTLFIPETLQLRQVDAHQGPLHRSNSGWLSRMTKTVVKELSRVWSFVLASKHIMLLVLADGLCSPIYIAFEMNMLQYVTKRFHWGWSMATYLTTINKGTSVVVLLVVLPLVTGTLTKRLGLAVLTRELYLCRGSVLFMLAGSLLTAFAAMPWLLIASLVIFSLGNGFDPQLRALLAGLVEQDSMATLNTTLATAETLMGLVGVPVLGWLLSKGFELGGTLMGLPFFMTSAWAALAAVTMFLFRLPVGSNVKVEGGYHLVNQPGGAI